MIEKTLREKFEKVIDEFHELNVKFVSDQSTEEYRRVVMKRYQVVFTLILDKNGVSFDTYADLKSGVYELGDLHTMVRFMLKVREKCKYLGFREMNTTERLYPSNRIGDMTRTSEL